MTAKQLMDKFGSAFLAAISEQNSWGKDQVKNLFFLTLSDVLLEIIDNEEDAKLDNNRIS